MAKVVAVTQSASSFHCHNTKENGNLKYQFLDPQAQKIPQKNLLIKYTLVNLKVPIALRKNAIW